MAAATRLNPLQPPAICLRSRATNPTVLPAGRVPPAPGLRRAAGAFHRPTFMNTAATLVHSRHERARIALFANSNDASCAVAAEVAELVRVRQREGRMAVLGLATGSTPVSLYAELVRLHREEGLSFANVVSFNLDEYYPLTPAHPESYHHYMRAHLFDHVDIAPENVHIPSGTVPKAEIEAHCEAYEEAIREAGGIDIQILGIGRTGHIGFNEPGSPRRSRTRLIPLDPLTRRDAAGDFGGEEHTPRQALTMGVATILDARRIVLMAWGRHKAEVVRAAVEGEVTSQVTASFLQEHDNAEFVLDHAAASDRRRLQRGRPAGVAPGARIGLRGEPRRFLPDAAHDHGLARRARSPQDPARRRAGTPAAGTVGRRLSQAGARLFPAPRRRRHLDGRHALPAGRPGA